MEAACAIRERILIGCRIIAISRWCNSYSNFLLEKNSEFVNLSFL